MVNDASIKKKQCNVKDSYYYFIPDSDISTTNDDIISHYAYSNNLSNMYLTALSSSINITYIGNNEVVGRKLFVLCLDLSSQKIIPFSNTAISERVYINIFYIKH